MRKADVPFFSLLIPSFNRPELLKKTIESICKTDFTDIELIISDDLSDKSDVIKSLVASFTFPFRFSYYQQETNLGSVKNKNFLLSKALGKYIIFIGDDDTIMHDSLSKLFHEIKTAPKEIHIFGLGYNLIDEYDKLIASYCLNKGLLFERGARFPIRLLYEGTILPFWFFHPFTICIKNTESKLYYKDYVGIGYDFNYLYEHILAGSSILVLPIIFFNWRKAQLQTEYQNLSNGELSDIKSRIQIFRHFFLLNRQSLLSGKFNIENHFKQFICYTVFLKKYTNYSTIRNFISIELGDDFVRILERYKHENRLIIHFWFLRLRLFFQAFRLVGYDFIFICCRILFQKIRYNCT